MRFIYITIALILLLPIFIFACKPEYLSTEEILISDIIVTEGLSASCNITVYNEQGDLINQTSLINNSVFYNISLGILPVDAYVSSIECIKNETLYYGACDFEVIEEDQENKMISNILSLIMVIIYFVIIGIAVLNITKSFEISHNKMAFWLVFLSFGMALIELVTMLGLTYVSQAGGDVVGLLKVNFYAIALIGLGIGFTTLVFVVQNIFDFSTTDKEKW